MAEHDATVVPHQPWGQDGLADVWIRGVLNIFTTLKLENKGTTASQTKIKKSDYNLGLIRINTDNLPTGPTVELQVDVTSEESISHADWPVGGVLFI